VNLQKRNIGLGGFANTNAYGTGRATMAGSTVYGSAQGTAMTTGSVMANQNQEILFRCAK